VATAATAFFWRPRASPVEAHARGYGRHSFFLEATGLSRGGSRLWLPPPQLFSGGHGLVPWRLTLVATVATAFFWRPRASPVEAHARGYGRHSFFLEATG
jgi:hypothetical protein